MKGLFRRNAPADPSPQEQQPTMVVPQPPQVAPPEQPLPAGLAPEDVAPSRPSFRDRGRLRRRLRYLRRVRELGFRDLGGLAFDLHRFGRRNDDLVLGKLAALDAVDRELRAIERVLDDRRDILELREPGIAACPRCGALHGSDARFCPQCGIAFSGPLAMVEVGGVAQPVPEAAPIATQPVGEVSPAEPAPTPVSGALEGNPPPDAPPAVPEPAAPAEPTDAEQSAPSGLPGDDAEASAAVESGTRGETSGDNGGEQSTQAFSSLGGPGGDPLAQREHPDR
jgi:hypothetical protein